VFTCLLGEFESFAIVIEELDKFERKKLRKNSDSHTNLGKLAILLLLNYLKNLFKTMRSQLLVTQLTCNNQLPKAIL